MGIAGKVPRLGLEPLIEWRARRIADPIERLRFLRKAAAVTDASRLTSGFFQRWRWQLALTVTVCGFLLFASAMQFSTTNAHSEPDSAANPPSGVVGDGRLNRVWLVDHKDTYEVYSNGLRVETEFTAYNRPRGSYPVFGRDGQKTTGDAEEPFDLRSDPVGIVFHSTESHQAPFEPSETRNLKRIGRNLLAFIRQERAYHYVVDRFGRAYRVVPEADLANHAGKSVWVDEKGTYVNLNRSFFGIALEAQTEAPHKLNPAQLHTARILTEMLRSKYGIPAGNCVTHAQVSVNPSNWRVGWHTDWANSFPFGELGLPDNYAVALPSLTVFGFEYDSPFLEKVGKPRWVGLQSSDDQVRALATQGSVTVSQLRKQQQERYRRIINSAAMRAIEEDNHEAK